MGIEEFLINAVLLCYIFGVNTNAVPDDEKHEEGDDIDDLFRSTTVVNSMIVTGSSQNQNPSPKVQSLIHNLSSDKGPQIYKTPTADFGLRVLSQPHASNSESEDEGDNEYAIVGPQRTFVIEGNENGQSMIEGPLDQPNFNR